MMGMSVGFRNSTFPDRSPLKALSGCARGRRSIDALRPTRLPHTKWAWRHTAKCVICELGPVGNHSCVFCKMRKEFEQRTTPDVGWQRCWIGFLEGLEAARKPTRNQYFRLE